MANQTEKVKKILVASATACSLLLAGGTLALAQQPNTATPEASSKAENAGSPSGSNTSATTPAMQSSSLQSSQLMGKKLYGTDDREVGTIKNVTTGSTGKAETAVVETGGFLGIGTKRISIPVSDLQIKKGRVMDKTMTAGQIGKMPALNK